MLSKACTYTQSKDFLQAKLCSEINACFLSNDHVDLCFLLHNFGVKIILFKLQILKKILGWKEYLAKSVLKTVA